MSDILQTKELQDTERDLALDWVKIFNSALEVVKPTNLVTTLLRMFDNLTVAEWMRDLVALTELYWPHLREYWYSIKLLIQLAGASLRSKFTPKEPEPVGGTPEFESADDCPDLEGCEDEPKLLRVTRLQRAKVAIRRMYNRMRNGIAKGTHDLRHGDYDEIASTPEDVFVQALEDLTPEDKEEFCDEEEVAVHSFRDDMRMLKGYALCFWTMSKEAIMSVIAAVLSGCAMLAAIFPGAKYAKIVSDRFLQLLSSGNKIRSAKDDSVVVFDAVKETIEVTLGEKVVENALGDKVEWFRRVKHKCDQNNMLIKRPDFPLVKLRALQKDLRERSLQKDSFGTWARSLDFEVTAFIQRRLDLLAKQPGRPQPVVVLLAGPPGTGKTTFVKCVADAVNAHFGLEGWDTKQPVDYADNIEGKPVLVWEEFLLHKNNTDMQDLQRLADTSQTALNSDKIENKGKTEAPLVIIMTTNRENIYKDVSIPDAVARRIDFHMRVTNPGLENWHKANPGKIPTEAEYHTIHQNHHTLFARLPAGARNLLGDFEFAGTVGKANLINMRGSALVREVADLAKRRYTDYMGEYGNIDKTAFHACDMPILVFKGEPGTGKTTLAQTLGVEVMNDPWTSQTTWDALVDVVIHREDHTDHGVLVITTNSAPWDKMVADMCEEKRRAFLRRLTFFHFTFNKSGWFTWYTVKDLANEGWSKCVRICDDTGNGVSRAGLIDLVKDLKPVEKAEIVNEFLKHEESEKPVARTTLTINQVCSNPSLLALWKHFHVVDKNYPLKSTVFAVMKQVSTKKVEYKHPKDLVIAINDSKLKCVTPPCSVEFGDATLNFFSTCVDGKDILKCALVVAPERQRNPVRHRDLIESDFSDFAKSGVYDSDPFSMAKPAQDASEEVSMFKWTMPTAVWSLMLNVALTITGMVATALSMRYTMHSPDKGKTERGLMPRKRAPVAQKILKNVSVKESWEDKNDWLDEEEMDYENFRLDSADMKECVLEVYNGNTQQIGWAFSTSNGLVMNKHVADESKKVGFKSVGECKVTGITHTDLVVMCPLKGNPYKQSKIAFGLPQIGDEVIQLTRDGFGQRSRVVKTKAVNFPGGMKKVAILESRQSIPGDCGLPWVRKVGDSLELVGIHTGLCGGLVMITPLYEAPILHAGTFLNKTYLYKTQYKRLNPDLDGMMPAPKCGTFNGVKEDTDQLIVRCLKPFFSPVSKQHHISEPVVQASMNYVKWLCADADMTPWSLQASVLSLDFTTSAGPQYGVVKSEVFNPDGTVKPRFERIWKKGIRDLPDPTCQVTIKDEMRPENKWKVGASRPIFCFNVHTVARVKRFMGPVLKHLMETVGSHPFAVGCSLNNGSWNEMAVELLKLPFHIDADFARWDSCVDRDLIFKCFRVLTAPLDDIPRERMLEEYRVISQVVTQFGPTQCGLPSGICGTSHLNCAVHILLVNQCLYDNKRPLLGEPGCPITFYSYGDDFVAGVRHIEMKDELVATWKRMGFTATNALKTGEPSVTPLVDISFLKRRFRKGEDGFWYAPLEFKSITRSLAFARHHTGYNLEDEMREMTLVGTRHVNQVQSALAEAWQHGREGYNKLKDMLIKCSKAGSFRLPVIIPTFDRFSPSDVAWDIAPDLGDHNNQRFVQVITHIKTYPDKDMADSVNSAGQGAEVVTNSAGGPVGVVAGMPLAPTPVVNPTPGVETEMGTTGGSNSTIDPAIRETATAVPGGMFSINTASVRGTRLFQIKVGPWINAFTKYLMVMYNAWGGAFDIFTTIGANNFIGGKILAVFTPPQKNPSDYSMDELLSFPGKVILDIRDMDNKALTCGDIKNVLWHPTNDDSEQGFCGWFSLWLYTNVVTAGTGDVTVDMQLLSRPTESFDFRMLVPPSARSGINSESWYTRHVRHLASCRSIAGWGSAVQKLVVLLRSANTVIGNLWGTTCAVDGSFETYSQNSQCLTGGGVVVKLKYSGATGIYWLVCYDRFGAEWDMKDGYSQSVPTDWPAFTPQTSTTFFMEPVSGGNTFVPVTWAPQGGVGRWTPRVTGLNDGLDGRQMIFYWSPSGKEFGRSLSSFSPPNGESLVMFANVTTTFVNGLGLSTTEAVSDRMNNPTNVKGEQVALLNVVDGSGIETMEVKLYPNGVMTAGGVDTTLLVSAPFEFKFVGMVPQSYKLKNPTGTSAFAFELESALHEWLSLEPSQSEENFSPLRQILVQRLGLPRSMPTLRKNSSCATKTFS
uniref:Genome polyprotein n=1 Tax=Barramundi calicivirus 1 TaxID=3162777 RepID=A0AAU7P143_9CALI